MIQANELRVGNWVKHEKEHYSLDPDLYYNEYVKVTSLTDGDYLHWECGSPFGGRCVSGQMYKNTDPIPLTPEILEKSGFIHEVHDDTSYYKNSELWFCHIGEDWHLANGAQTFKPFQHLHQLQNLYYALTGKELDIKL